MAKFPNPPSIGELRNLGPEPLLLPKGSALWRVYFKAGKHPVAWGTFRTFGPVASSRFDHHVAPPADQARGILYATARGPTCVAEVFQETRTIDRGARDPWLVAFEVTRGLVLHDLQRTWPTRAGGSSAIHSGRRDRARLWSQAMYEAFPDIDGLAYCSSMDGNRPAYAIYERAQSAMPARPVFHRALRDPVLLAALTNTARELGYVVV